MPEGIVAAFEFDAGCGRRRQRGGDAEAIDGLAVGEIVRASRDATIDGVTAAEGDFLAMLDGRAFAARPELWAVVDQLLDRFAADGRSLVQVLRGEGAPEAEEIESRIEARGLEPDVKWGGQPHYPLLLSAE